MLLDIFGELRSLTVLQHKTDPSTGEVNEIDELSDMWMIEVVLGFDLSLHMFLDVIQISLVLIVKFIHFEGDHFVFLDVEALVDLAEPSASQQTESLESFLDHRPVFFPVLTVLFLFCELYSLFVFLDLTLFESPFSL